MVSKLIIFSLLLISIVAMPFTNKKSFIRKKSENFALKQIEENLKLIRIHGNAYEKSASLISLIFNQEVNLNYFSRFYLTDLNPIYSYAYYLGFTFYKSKYNSSVDCFMNFKNVPAGTYYFNFVYKNISYSSNVTLTVKEKKLKNENELLAVYSDFKEKKDNQIAFFSFYGKNKNNNLSYIVLDNGFSTINVLETFGCEIIHFDEISYDLKCNLNLTNVGEGKYTVSELFINNQHYFTNKNIKVNVKKINKKDF